MSLTNLLPAPKTVQIGTRSVTAKPFTINEISRLQEWINKTYRSPLADILPTLHTLDKETQRSVLAQAKSWTAPQFGTAEADEMLRSIGGLYQVFKIIVTSSDPKLTEADAVSIAGEVDFAQFTDLAGELMLVAFGVSEDQNDPKAETSELSVTSQ